MNTLNHVLLALGQGDPLLGARLAAIAILTGLPASVVLALFLALGPAR